MSKIQIGDEIFHPCSVDIIKHKVISIRQFEDFTHYVLKAVSNVGACGRIEVIVDEHKGKLRFVELVGEENVPHASGLQDFVEGNYYTTIEKAKVEFYDNQRIIAWSSMEKAERAYKKAKEHYNQIELLIKTFKR